MVSTKRNAIFFGGLLFPADIHKVTLVFRRSNRPFDIIACDNAVERCGTNPTGSKVACFICRSNTDHFVRTLQQKHPNKGHQKISLKSFTPTKSNSVSFQDIRKSILSAFCTLSDIVFFESMKSVFWQAKSPSLTRQYDELKNAALKFLSYLKTLKDEYDYHDVYTFNGRFVGPAQALLVWQKKTICFDSSMVQTSVVFSRGSTVHEPKVRSAEVARLLRGKNFKEMEKLGSDVTNSKALGKYINFQNYSKTFESFTYSRKRDLYVVFTSTENELKFLPDKKNYIKSQTSEVKKIIRWLLDQNIDGSKIVVRMHPNQASLGNGAEVALRKKLQGLPCVIYGPKDSVNSYNLMTRSLLVFGFSSSTLVEASTLDVPIVYRLADSFWSDFVDIPKLSSDELNNIKISQKIKQQKKIKNQALLWNAALSLALELDSESQKKIPKFSFFWRKLVFLADLSRKPHFLK